jgi:hypothetical protein
MNISEKAKYHFRQMLEEGYLVESSGGIMSRLEYLSDYIFDFTTYDSGLSVEMARQAIATCKAINDRSTFDYIADPIQYRSFIYNCNLPFFISKLDWGTSIRFPWWDSEIVFHSVGLWLNGEQIYYNLYFKDDEWKAAVRDMLEFSQS